MPTAASGKWKLMIRSAGIPMLSISGEALKKPRSVSGMVLKRTVPKIMMTKASVSENLSASSMRDFFRAP